MLSRNNFCRTNINLNEQTKGVIPIKEIDVVEKSNKTIIFENTYDSETEEELNEKVKKILIELINS